MTYSGPRPPSRSWPSESKSPPIRIAWLICARATIWGFAGESERVKNRQVCLTNKIFTYLLAGMPVALSDTEAQRRLASCLGDAAFLYQPSDTRGLAEWLRALAADEGRLRRHRLSGVGRRGAALALESPVRRGDAPVTRHAHGRMKILLVMDPFIPVPPRHYGGIERVVADLGDALVARGHDVTLWAAPGSSLRGRVEPFGREAEWTRWSNVRNTMTLALAVSGPSGRLRRRAQLWPARVPVADRPPPRSRKCRPTCGR